nr:hypothetical protein [uncultured Aminipila sp.]
MEVQKTKVYIKVDFNNNITAVDADWNIKNSTGWIQIDEGIGDKYHHAQGNYFDKPLTILTNGKFIHNYVYENSTIRETTAEEKATELINFPAPEPTDKERISLLETLALQLGGVI